ncbi:MAG TPA: YibE/F family protein [Candidatus Sulfotelmatobacter sp.]|nr:YibE/F family protein [Candidatus Sulfotelmatobacter sp.]
MSLGERLAGLADRLEPRPLLLPAVAIALLSLVLALPDLSGIPTGQGTVTAYQGTLTAVVANPTQLPGGGFAPDATVHMLDGPDAGHDVPAYLQGPGGTEDLSSFHVGDAVVVTYTPQPGAGPFIAVTDHWRLPQLGLLALLFAVAVVLVGGWRGTRALLALGLTIAVIVRIVLPLIVAGYPPVPLAVVAATAVTLLTILLTEGFSVASVAAILGTAAALALTGLLGAAAAHFAQFTTVGAADLAQIQTSAGGAGLDLSGLLLAAFILGSLGILEDVTMTQAVVVEELSADGSSAVRELYGRGLRVGRAHIAATVNTLFLAYVGAGLPLLVLLVVSQLPAGQVLNGETLAVEIVRALVGSVGIVAAVPITTLVAAVLVHRRFERDPAAGISLADPLPSLIGGLVAIGVVAGLATFLVGPLGSPRQAQATDRPLTAIAPSAAPTGSAAPTIEPSGEPSNLPPIADVGAPTPVMNGSTRVGTVTVLTIDPTTTGSTTRIAIEVRYAAGGARWSIDPRAWSVITADSSRTTITAGSREPVLRDETLPPDATLDGWFEVTMPAAAQDPFLLFEAVDGTELFVVPLT